tara:strand:- start:63 stop:1601 length:1539 start_codon:yes stop_codon:yes gene_type:complete
MLKEKQFYKDFNVGKLGWKFIDSISTGRYKLSTASGDLGDNSDDAGATKFWTDLIGPSDSIQKIIYADNGSGMDYKTLEGSYTLGFERTRTSKQLGKFGVGGTMGCLNIATEKLTITRDYMGKTIARQYDLSDVKEKDCWGTSAVQVTKEMEDLLNSYVGENGTGTVIIISQFDRNNFGRRKDNLVRDLGNYYSSIYCEKIASGNFKVILDGKELESKDPLMWYDNDVIRVIDEKIPGTNYRIRLANLKNIRSARGNTEQKGLLVKQGGYFFRCNRLIKGRVINSDTWSKTWDRNAHYRHVRWGVYFDADGDKEMGVTSDKSDVTPSQSIGDKIGQIVMPEARIIFREAVNKESTQTKDDKVQELQNISSILQEMSKKENLDKASVPDLSLDKDGEIVIEENVVILPSYEVSIPSYVTADVSLGQVSEPFRLIKNPDKMESRWKLEINTDHRYISKYYLNCSKEVRNAVISWIVPYAFSIMINPDTDTCDMLDFRNMFNRKLTQVTTKIDNL